MDKKHARFLNLERSRREAQPEASPLRDSSRFGAVESPPEAPLGESVRSGARVERFEEPEVKLELHDKRSGNQPFSQCVHCLADSPPFAVTCIRCGARFDTFEQRTYNETLWQERLKLRAQEEASLATLQADRVALEQIEAKRRREFAENLAREAKESALARMNLPAGGLSSTPLLVRMLRSVKNPFVRFAIGIGVVGLPLLLLVFSPRGSGLRVVGALSLLVGLFLVVPPRLLGRRVRRWGSW